MRKSPWGDDNEENNDSFSSFGREKKFQKFNIPELSPFSPKSFLWIIVGALLLWLATGFYKVNEGEEAAVLRFGRYVRTANAGLNYHLPYPFETVLVEGVTKSRRIEIGYRSNSFVNDSQKSVSHESKMLTGDENIIELTCDVMWHINDLSAYLFNIAAAEDAVKTAAESAIREVIGETPIASVLSSQKQEIATRIEDLVQKTLDSYTSGIEIEMVQLLRAEPPTEVIDAYRDVQTSRADKEREINQALTYNNDILPKARGEAAKLVQNAEAYKQEVISKAQGDSQRFLSVYAQYQMQRSLTRDRIYLDMMEEVLKGSNKYVVGADMLPHMAIGKK
jgi:membrane protease subunit HflK